MPGYCKPTQNYINLLPSTATPYRMAPHNEPSFFYQSIDITEIQLPENKSRGSRLHRSTKMIETETETETVLKYPRWNLERRPSSGQLFWQNIASPRSKVSFRFDVEVLEFEKDPAEDIVHEEGCSVSSTIAICVTCMAAVAVSVILPWYLMNST